MMNDTTRSIFMIVILIVVFGLSYIAYSHIDNSVKMNTPVEIKRLELENDSLKTVINQLKEDIELKEKTND